jgi:L-ascorbate 6-phosphate lactonase
MWRGVGDDPTVLHKHAASYEYPRALEVAKIGDRPISTTQAPHR